MTVFTTIAFVLLAIAGAFCLARLLRGPSFSDRAVALDTLLVVAVCGIATESARTGSAIYIDVLVVAALLGFAGTALVARFIERRGAR